MLGASGGRAKRNDTSDVVTSVRLRPAYLPRLRDQRAGSWEERELSAVVKESLPRLTYFDTQYLHVKIQGLARQRVIEI